MSTLFSVYVLAQGPLTLDQDCEVWCAGAEALQQSYAEAAHWGVDRAAAEACAQDDAQDAADAMEIHIRRGLAADALGYVAFADDLPF